MTRTLREVANFLVCAMEGDGEAIVSGVASAANARASDLIYVESPRLLDQAAASASRCVVIGPDLPLPGKNLLRSSNPKLTFARAAEWLLPPAIIAEGIHPTAVIAPSAELAPGAAVGPYAVIEEDAQIGPGTEIGAFCFLGRGVQIGEKCRLFPRITIYSGCRLGNRVTVHSGVVIGSDGFGYVADAGKHRKFPQIGDVEIQDDVEIGANTTIDRGSLDRTEIGTGTKVDNLVQIAHNARIGKNSIVASQTGVSGSVILGNNVVVGGQVGIADHCRIEDGVVIGAQAGIPSGKIVHKGLTVWGTPARPLEKVKILNAWLGRLPDLAERIKRLETILLGKGDEPSR